MVPSKVSVRHLPRRAHDIMGTGEVMLAAMSSASVCGSTPHTMSTHVLMASCLDFTVTSQIIATCRRVEGSEAGCMSMATRLRR